MKKINWKDFKIKDLQPNLIENGWDSFEPYGFGEFIGKAPKEVFEENYAQNELLNGDFKGDMSNWNGYSRRENGYVAIGRDWDLKQYFDEKKGDYKIVAKIKSLNNNTLRPWATQYKKDGTQINSAVPSYITPEKWEIIEIELTDDEFIGIAFLSNISNEDNVMLVDWIMLIKEDENPLKYYPNWNDLPDEEKPVDTYEEGYVYKQSLENGLTRIQTWGGNHEIKLLNADTIDVPNEATISQSMYIENIGENNFRFRDNRMGKYNNLNVGEAKFVELIGVIPVNILYSTIRMNDDGNTLDFIASDPQIVEGDKANPVLLINELEDGREHVQVYGAYPDTKLISKEVQGFSGEPYQIKTDIDNDGVELTMTSTLGDKSIDVNKGSNSISHTGELQGQHIIIELGAKDE